MKCWTIWRLLLSNFRYHHASGSDVCCGASGKLLQLCDLRSDPVATVDGCAYERDYIERSAVDIPTKIESRQDSQKQRSENTWRHFETQTQSPNGKHVIKQKHGRKLAEFIRNKYSTFLSHVVSSSRGGLEKGDKSIRSSPLQPQASR